MVVKTYARSIAVIQLCAMRYKIECETSELPQQHIVLLRRRISNTPVTSINSSAMSQQQKASFLLEKQGKFEVGTRAIPTPQGKQVLVKVTAAASKFVYFSSFRRKSDSLCLVNPIDSKVSLFALTLCYIQLKRYNRSSTWASSSNNTRQFSE